MFPAIQVGPLSVQTGPIIVILSFVLALEAVHRCAARLGLSGDDTYNLGYVAAGAGVVGARLGHVLEYWSVYRHDLSAILALTPTGLSAQAGLLVGLAAGWWYARRKRLAKRLLLDALVPGLVILAGGMALADLAGGNSYGTPSTVPWAIVLWGVPRHPLQIYHLLAALASGVVALRATRPFDGAHFGLFLLLFAASRLFVDAWRDGGAGLAGFRTVQVVSLAALLVALWLVRRWALDTAPRSQE